MEEKKTLQERLEDAKLEMKWRYQLAREWCSKHKAEIVVFGPVIISGVVEVIKITTKKHNVNEEKRLKDNYIYDRSQGHYYELRRKLKSSEWLLIDQRKREGESLGQILQDMRVLK